MLEPNVIIYNFKLQFVRGGFFYRNTILNHTIDTNAFEILKKSRRNVVIS